MRSYNTICVHCLVRNEDRFIWYAVSSVVNYVDRVMLWDMGSSDTTSKLCSLLADFYPDKISYKQLLPSDPGGVTMARNTMLKNTPEDWVWLLDGDEIWWDEAAAKTAKILKTAETIDYLIHRYLMCTASIFRFLPDSASRYEIGKLGGYINIRVMKRSFINKVAFMYPNEAYLDADGTPIQKSKGSPKIVDGFSYLHTSHLIRSSSKESILGRRGFQSPSLGNEFPNDFYYPEVFFRPRPALVASVWDNPAMTYKLKGATLDLARKIKHS